MSKVVQQLYFDKVKAYFHGDTTATWMWYKSPNPALGMVSPIDVIRGGRMNTVMDHIDKTLQGMRRM